MKKKLLNITHSDLDGVSCAFLFKLLENRVTDTYISNSNSRAEDLEVCIKFIEKPSDLNTATFINNLGCYYDECDYIYISDLDLSDFLYENIMRYEFYDKITILDHHTNSLKISKSDNPDFLIADKERCGTKLVHDYLKAFKYRDYNINPNGFLDDYVRLVDLYDRGQWKHDEKSKFLNILFNSYNSNTSLYLNDLYKKFNINNDLKLNTYNFTNNESIIIETLMGNILYNVKNTKIFEFKYKELLAGATFINDKNVSVILDEILKKNTHLNFIANIDINKESVSLRTSKDNVDLAQIANRFNGGGHKQAAGFPLNNKVFYDTIKEIFKK